MVPPWRCSFRRSPSTTRASYGSFEPFRPPPITSKKNLPDEVSAAKLETFARRIVAQGNNRGIVLWDWKPWHEVTARTYLTEIPFSEMNLDNTEMLPFPRLAFPLTKPGPYAFRKVWRPDLRSFTLWFWRRGSRGLGPFPPDDDPQKIQFLLEKWKEAATIFEPHFAMIDMYEPALKNRRDKDVRQHAFGVTLYGPDLVKRVGRDKILSAPAHKVEELPWGGAWVQAAENPFETPPAAKRAIEKHLDLKRAFANEENPNTP